MKKTNFDLFLEEQLRDPDFAERFKQAGEAWDTELQAAARTSKQRAPARKFSVSGTPRYSADFSQTHTA